MATTKIHKVLADPDRWLATLLAVVSLIANIGSPCEIVAVFKPRIWHPKRDVLHATQHPLCIAAISLIPSTERDRPVVGFSSGFGGELALGLRVQMYVHAPGLVEEANADEVLLVWNIEAEKDSWGGILSLRSNQQCQSQPCMTAFCSKDASLILFVFRVLELGLVTLPVVIFL